MRTLLFFTGIVAGAYLTLTLQYHARPWLVFAFSRGDA